MISSLRARSARRGAARSTRTLVALAALALALLPLRGALAAPAAGTLIGNAASATYSDGSGVTRTVTSNVVTTVVQQVASLTLVQDLARTASIGGQIAYPVTLTNTGNGTDSFALATSQSGGFSFTSVNLYADANADGIPDDLSSPITGSGPLAAGAVFSFVAVGNVPGSATAGQTNDLVVTATSAFDAGESASVTDTTTISANAVLAVTKAMSANSGDPGSGPYTVTLSYVNTGNDTATDVAISDLLPVGFDYVGGSARWSGTGATVLTDLDDADTQGTAPNTVVYDFGVTALRQVTAVVDQVLPGASGTITFQVTIASGTAPGLLLNTASYEYDDGSGDVGPFSSNTVSFRVNATAGVTLDGDTVAGIPQGGTATFTNLLTNTGNGTDSFDITLAASSFPVGTGFTLFQSDGVTPLLDTNGNGIPDTGPVAAGASYDVVLKATLPPAATGGPYTVNKVATSGTNVSVTDTGTDTLTAISASTVDLTNGAALPGGAGSGLGPEGAAVTTNSANPGTTTRFTLYVNNTGSVPDTYDLAASTDASFATLALPAGWTVVFRDSALTVITNTGSIGASANRLVYADVAVPAGQAALPSPGQAIYFRALSPTSGSLDRKRDAVIVNTVRSVTLLPNQSGQIFPGGTAVYAHTLRNAGNVTENDGVSSTITLSLANTASGFTSLVYLDVNDDGQLDPGDTLVDDPSDLGALAPGATLPLLVRVTAPPGAPIGAIDVATLTATSAGSVNGVAAPAAANATDTSTVVAGNVSLEKRQAVDAACDGTPDGAFVAADLSAAPGACIVYQITATNLGTENATDIVISDATPANTTFEADVPATTTRGAIATPADGATGTVTVSDAPSPALELAPGETVVVQFGVRIDP